MPEITNENSIQKPQSLIYPADSVVAYTFKTHTIQGFIIPGV